MKRTLFAGLTALDPGDPLSTDGYSFQSRNPVVTDRFLELGAVTHRHNAHPAYPDPVIEPSAFASAGSGTIPAGTPIFVGYTLNDTDNGETRVSPVVTITTEDPIEDPTAGFAAVHDYAAGTLRADTYYYAITLTDGVGGETLPGPAVSVEREPGFPSGRVLITGLSGVVAAASAAGWRMYRATGGGQLDFLASGVADAFTDDGLLQCDCNIRPPRRNTTHGANKIGVVVPSAAYASAFNIYLSLDGGFTSPCLFNQFPIQSAGTLIEVTSLVLDDGQPPDVSTCVPGASKIDPDTEILDMHWKRPVATSGALPAGDQGDVRVALDTGLEYAVLGSAGADFPFEWSQIGGPGGHVNIQVGTGVVASASIVEFRGSGSAAVFLASSAADHAIITVSASAGLPCAAASGSGFSAPVQNMMFQGSGSVQVSISQASGSAVVTIYDGGSSASAATGPMGPAGADGAVGPAGAAGPAGPPGSGVVQVAASGSGSVSGASAIMFKAGNASTAVSVASAAGVSAVVTISALPGPSPPTFSPATRGTTSAVTSGLASGSDGLTDMPLGPAYRLIGIATDRPARVRLYIGSAYRAADLVRPIGTDPTGNHGQIMEFVTTSDQLGWAVSPAIDGFLEDPLASAVPMTVTNMGASGAVTVALTYLMTESTAYLDQRTVVTASASGLASTGVASGISVPLGKSFRLFNVHTNKASRIRLYPTSGYAQADIARPANVQPTGDHGCLMDFTASAAGHTWAMAPEIDGYDDKPVPDGNVVMTVQNLGASGTVIADFEVLSSEKQRALATGLGGVLFTPNVVASASGLSGSASAAVWNPGSPFADYTSGRTGGGSASGTTLLLKPTDDLIASAFPSAGSTVIRLGQTRVHFDTFHGTAGGGGGTGVFGVVTAGGGSAALPRVGIYREGKRCFLRGAGRAVASGDRVNDLVIPPEMRPENDVVLRALSSTHGDPDTPGWDDVRAEMVVVKASNGKIKPLTHLEDATRIWYFDGLSWAISSIAVLNE